MNNGNMQMQPSAGGSVVDSLFAGNLTGSFTGSSIKEVKQLDQYDQRSHQEGHQNPREHMYKQEIRKLARDINKSLDNYEPSKAQTEEEDEKEKEDIINVKEELSILNVVKEMSLIVAIYVIMSQGFVRKLIAGYIPQLNPIDGTIPFTGYLIYGAILALLFVFFRYFVIK